MLQIGVDVGSVKGDLVLRATSSELVFAGYQAAYATSHFRSAAATSSSDDDEEEKLKAEASLVLLKVHSCPGPGPSLHTGTTLYRGFVTHSLGLRIANQGELLWSAQQAEDVRLCADTVSTQLLLACRLVTRSSWRMQRHISTSQSRHLTSRRRLW